MDTKNTSQELVDEYTAIITRVEKLKPYAEKDMANMVTLLRGLGADQDEQTKVIIRDIWNSHKDILEDYFKAIVDLAGLVPKIFKNSIDDLEHIQEMLKDLKGAMKK